MVKDGSVSQWKCIGPTPLFNWCERSGNVRRYQRDGASRRLWGGRRTSRRNALIPFLNRLQGSPSG